MTKKPRRRHRSVAEGNDRVRCGLASNLSGALRASDPGSRPPASDTATGESRIEALADGVVHVLGLGLSVAGLAVLVGTVSATGDPVRDAAILVYGVALVATLGISALYNTLRGTGIGPFLRRLDHAMIFLMIAATYTPFLAVAIAGDWGWGLLAFVWGVALAGAALKLIEPGRFERLAIVLYLGLGWVIVIAPGPLFDAVSAPGIGLLALGGLLYSGGVVFHLLDRLRFSRALWHGSVLLAAGCHYLAVWGEVARPGSLW
ncbi:MAG: hemolysin III family protein [Rhodospirillales bacterium]|nr:MAG: hemolysin III family protein [Rhodospirillales bacterium]